MQFKDQRNTLAIVEAVAEQLQDVYLFYEQLRTLRHLETAAGKQLDGIGNIVVMSRSEAAALAGLSGADEMWDELYRKFLKYKLFLNTSNGTYRDVLNGLKMFVPDIPLYYTEDPAHPATMYFDTPDLTDDDIEYIFKAPIARAAGVQVVIRARTRTPLFLTEKVLTLDQYKWTRKTQPQWIRPGDERNLYVAELAQFKTTITSPQSFGTLPKLGTLDVYALTQFRHTQTEPPEFIRFAPTVSVRTFGQFRVTLGNPPVYQN